MNIKVDSRLRKHNIELLRRQEQSKERLRVLAKQGFATC